MSDGPTTFVHRRVVAFSETDAAGMVHFSVFFRWMEDCEHAMVRSLGSTVHATAPGGGFIGFPRRSAAAEFLRPLRFEDRVEVQLTVVERRTRALRYAFVITREGEDAPCATGSTSVICCTRDERGTLVATPLPPAFDGVRGEEEP